MRKLQYVFGIVLISVGAHAQIPDPGEGETPEEPTNPSPEFCDTCCQTMAEFICARDGCICTEDEGGWCFGVASVASLDVPPEAPVEVGRTLQEALARYEMTPLGRQYAEALERYNPQLVQIYLDNPELVRSTGNAILEHWPRRPKDTALVTNEAVAAARNILTRVADTDRKTGSGSLADFIMSDVVPRLRKELVGRPFPEALDCFMAEGC